MTVPACRCCQRLRFALTIKKLLGVGETPATTIPIGVKTKVIAVGVHAVGLVKGYAIKAVVVVVVERLGHASRIAIVGRRIERVLVHVVFHDLSEEDVRELKDVDDNGHESKEDREQAYNLIRS